MAKLIYENDNGQRITFDVAQVLIQEKGIDTFLTAFKETIETAETENSLITGE
jgi:hypothetical protein